MKVTEFRKLIREEIRKVLKEEESQQAYALVVDEEGFFMQEDLMEYNQESELSMDGIKLDNNEALEYAESVEATENPRILEKWMRAIKTLSSTCDFYDVTAGGGEGVVVAAIPRGSNLQDYITGEEYDY